MARHSSEQREYDARNHPVYYLTLPKSKIYKRMIEENPSVKLSISTFYRLCDKNFKKPTKKTDVCPVCKRAKSLLKKITSNLPENLRTEYLEEYKAYEQHYLVGQNQREVFNYQKNNLEEGSCIIVMDFKQNIKL